MPQACRAAFKKALAGARCYLEYGSGGTTIAALRAGLPTLSVESDSNWHRAVAARAATFDVPAHLIHADIGPTENWGYPADTSGWTRYHTYPLFPWDRARELGFSPDLVLIDGRFRIACFLASVLFSAPGTTILFDDYADRTYDQIVEQHVKPAALVERMARFTVPAERDRDALWRALTAAITDPS